MSEFTYLFRGRQATASPDQRQKHMEKWVAWFKELNGKGIIKNPGHPLDFTGKVVNGKGKTVKDGPYAEAKDVVGGFIVVEARISTTLWRSQRAARSLKLAALLRYGSSRF